MLGDFDFFPEDVGNVLFAINVLDVNLVLFLVEANTKFVHVDMVDFLRHRYTFGPVQAAAVVIPNGSGGGAIGECKVFEQVLDDNDRFGTFISSIEFRLAGASSNSPLFMHATPADGSAHAKDDISQQGLDIRDGNHFGGGCSVDWVAGILGSPICICIGTILGGEGHVGQTGGPPRVKHILRSRVP
jgi:hypothetical protein